MKNPYIAELQPNTDVTLLVLVQGKDIRQKKTGEPYLSLMLADRSGEIDSKMWDNVEDILDSFDKDDFLRIRGRVQIFQNKPQLTIHRLAKIEENEVDLADFFPASQRNLDEMVAELHGIVSGFTNPHLQNLLKLMLDDPEIARRYRIAPAAKSIHHAWLGGLIEHVLSLCTLARMTASHYKEVDLDLLLTGVILHDIGKIHELHYERSFGYSTDGQLLGHIIIALRMVDDKLRHLPDFPPKLRVLIEHMIVSHHGELAYGSPKTPMFLEALLLHHLDNLDSKMESMRQHVKRDKSLTGEWAAYLPSMERSILKKDKYLDPPPTVVVPKPEPPKKTESPAASIFGDKLKRAIS